MKILGDFRNGLVDFLYPPCCSVCGEAAAGDEKSAVCPSCLTQLRPLRPPLCLSCGREMTQGTADDTHMCGNCLQDAPPYNQARSWFHYEAPITTLLHRLKFLRDSGAADILAKLILCHAHGFDPTCYDCAIPVPLHPCRLRQRGLNQSMVLARALFAANRSALHPVTLKKTRDTVAQTGLDGVTRRKNLSGAFVIPPQSSVVGQHVCLIDDVFTTGTTVAECARVLKNGGAASVDVWTVARA